jgi:hypothetical protein
MNRYTCSHPINIGWLIAALLLMLSFTAAAQDKLPTDAPYYFNEWRVVGHSSRLQTDEPAVPALKSAGFSDADLRQWSYFVLGGCQGSACFVNAMDQVNTVIGVDVQDLVAWKASGLTPEEALFYFRSLVSQDDAVAINKVAKSKCADQVNASLSGVNPYSSKGKCYLLQNFQVLQLLSHDLVLLDSGENLLSGPSYSVMAYYGKADAPGEGASIFLALVKSKGAMQYQNAAGATLTVPGVVVLYTK